MSGGPPRPCVACGVRPVAFTEPRVDFCYSCLPGGPFTPPPCRRCRATGNYYSAGLCSRCHQTAPQHVASCRDCLAWGVGRRTGFWCPPCYNWRREHRDDDRPCARCGRTAPTNAQGWCRPCFRQSRTDPDAKGRWHQLVIALPSHAHRAASARATRLPAMSSWTPPPRPPRRSRQLVLFTHPAPPTGPQACLTCGQRPVIAPGKAHCHHCVPGGPITPPPCRRCGATNDYYSAGLCSRCHKYAPRKVDSCRDCLAWGATRTNSWLCAGCRSWRRNHPNRGLCTVCHRTMNLRDGVCRLCWRQASSHRGRRGRLDLPAANAHGQQLFLADTFTRRRTGTSTSTSTTPTAQHHAEPVLMPPPPALHRQLLLFDAIRTYTTGHHSDLAEPLDPVLGAYLRQYAGDFATRHGWNPATLQRVRSALRILLATQDTPGAPIKASDIAELGAHRPVLDPLTALLAEANWLEEDRTPAIHAWFDRMTTTLPTPMADEVRIWFTIQLNGSPKPPRSRPRHPKTVQANVRRALPALHRLAGHHTSLREVTRENVLAVLPASGTPRSTTASALKSLFSTLKAHKVTFTNPTSRIPTGPTANRPPLPLDLTPLREALAAADPARALLAALTGFHALAPRQLRGIHTTDLRDGRLHLTDRVIVLADPVRERLAAYLRHRDRHWPNTANPHLLVNHRTAGNLRPVRAEWITVTLGQSAQAVLEDRILHEAQTTGGDLRRLCDLFGLSVDGATRYIQPLDHPALGDLQEPGPHDRP